MQGQITLSKKEKRYQFVYLIFMLMAALILLSIIFLKTFASPFSDADVFSLETLDQKAKYNERQKLMIPIIDSTFNSISKLTAEMPQPLEENEIKYKINDINGAYDNVNVNDLRKEGYHQIAAFYTMYFVDKKNVSKITDDIKAFEKQYEDCTIGYKDRKRDLIQRTNDLKNR